MLSPVKNEPSLANFFNFFFFFFPDRSFISSGSHRNGGCAKWLCVSQQFGQKEARGRWLDGAEVNVTKCRHTTHNNSPGGNSAQFIRRKHFYARDWIA